MFYKLMHWTIDKNNFLSGYDLDKFKTRFAPILDRKYTCDNCFRVASANG